MPEKDLRIPTTPRNLIRAVLRGGGVTKPKPEPKSATPAGGMDLMSTKAEIKYESRSPIKTTLTMQRIGKKAERQSVSWTSISGSSVTMRTPPPAS